MKRVPPKQRNSARVNVIVETPAGSRNKFKYDEALDRFVLNKRLPRGARFPFDFGFIPGTRAEDGDPLDVLIVDDESCPQGAVVTVRLLGTLEFDQTERGTTVRNDRLIGMAETDKIQPTERSLGDLPDKLLDEIEHFFVSYNRAEGRVAKPLGRSGPKAAASSVERAIRARRAARKK